MPKVEQVSHNSGRGRRGRGQRVSTSLAEINVVPLVDVMLVLLIIFMVSAPMMQQGFGVQLPQSTRSRPITAEPINVAIPLSFVKDETVVLNGARVRLSFLAERIRQELQGRTSQDVYLGADGQVPYQAVVTVMDELKAGGVRNAMLVLAPSDGRRRE
jgi:biopolymer transport protein ExbD